MVGRTILDTSSHSSSIFGSIVSSVKGDINGAVINITHYLNIHDFYSVHLLDYCEGYYTPPAAADSTYRQAEMSPATKIKLRCSISIPPPPFRKS